MADRKYALLIDLDGVLYQQNELIAGALDSMRWIEKEHIDYLYLTNTTSKCRASLLDKFRQMGFDAKPERIITPIVATSQWFNKRGITSAALFVKPDACHDFSGVKAVDIQDPVPVEAVVIGDLGEAWDYATLNSAFRFLLQEPRPVLIALGMTRYWRGNDGLNLDVAPFVKALEHATDCMAEVIGKPSANFFHSALDIIGYPADKAIMIGDDILGDVDGGRKAGMRGLLVKTGKFREQDLETSIEIDGLLESFADLPTWWNENIKSK